MRPIFAPRFALTPRSAFTPMLVVLLALVLIALALPSAAAAAAKPRFIGNVPGRGLEGLRTDGRYVIAASPNSPLFLYDAAKGKRLVVRGKCGGALDVQASRLLTRVTAGGECRYPAIVQLGDAPALTPVPGTGGPCAPGPGLAVGRFECFERLANDWVVGTLNILGSPGQQGIVAVNFTTGERRDFAFPGNGLGVKIIDVSGNRVLFDLEQRFGAEGDGRGTTLARKLVNIDTAEVLDVPFQNLRAFALDYPFILTSLGPRYRGLSLTGAPGAGQLDKPVTDRNVDEGRSAIFGLVTWADVQKRGKRRLRVYIFDTRSGRRRVVRHRPVRMSRTQEVFTVPTFDSIVWSVGSGREGRVDIYTRKRF